ncbi:hypothetical protein GNVKYODX_CDS91 [Acinetobacter phage vB_AbaM_AB3P2]|nr:hypothetical protein GNVKYODX_CDS91 [Acinetobacter phage vB_AbaM_AB3P2]
MKNRYIAVYAKDIVESHQYQKALFEKGFHWLTSGFEFKSYRNFYARFEDLKIITCFHDPSIDEESVKLTIDEIRSI